MSVSPANSKLKPLKAAATILWMVSLAGVIWALTMEDRFFAVGGKPIAYLKDVRKVVTYRSEDDVKWREATKNQGFFDGDRVSTGPNSSATVDFGEGRRGILGPDTIVSMSSITQPSGKSFIVNLIKGAIKPVVPPNAKNQLIVTSGVSTYFVEPGQTRGFSKPVGGAIREFNSKERFPVQARHTVAPAPPPKYVVPKTMSVKFAALPNLALPPPVPIAGFSKPTSDLKNNPIQGMKVVPAIDPIEEKSAEQVPLAQPMSTPLPASTPESAAPKPLPTAPLALAPVPKEKVAPKPVPTKTPRAIPDSVYRAAMPVLDKGITLQHYITKVALTDFVKESLSIKFIAPTQKPPKWKSGIQLEMGSKKTQFQSETGEVDISFKPEQISSASKSNLGSIPCVDAILRPMVSAEVDGKAVQKFSGDIHKISLCSLADAGLKLPLQIGLSRFDAPQLETRFFPLLASPATFPYSFTVSRADDFKKILPYLSSSVAFKVTRPGAEPDLGAYSVDDGKIGVRFTDQNVSAETANQMMEILGHDYVFRGSRSSVYSVASMSPPEFKDWVTKHSEAGKPVYIRTKGSVVPVSSDFISERPEVADFIKRAAGTVFLQKIEIVSYKSP